MQTDLELEYSRVVPKLEKVLSNILSEVNAELVNYPNVDKISGRVKSSESFLNKAKEVENGEYKYPNPFSDILDQIGVRIVVCYEQDVDQIKQVVEKLFRFIELDEKYKKESEFGYEAVHYILVIPPNMIPKSEKKQLVQFFELQICTLFQHAWAEANHNIMYKTSSNLNKNQKRKMYWAAAQAWGADRIFSEILKNENDD